MSQPMMDKTKGTVLGDIDIFSSLSEGDLHALSSKMRGRDFAPGEVMFREGEKGDELFVVVSGLVSVSVRSGIPSGAASGEAEDIELTRVGRGAFFGEMAILERATRSATCTALEETECLVLKAADFEALIVEAPNAAVGVLERMLGIAAGRLVKTGSFLSQMVQWGDDARRRAITDAATGLFNRRYLEDTFGGLLSRSSRDGQPLSFAMFDLDRFGKLNAAYGADFCDSLIVIISEVFRRVFGEDDILVRYGGDEFCFLIGSPPGEALRKCEGVCAELRSLVFKEHPELKISCSIGVAHFPEGGRTTDELKERADRALYLAKESGRDRALAWSPTGIVAPRDEEPKANIQSIARKNHIGANIIRAIEERDSFLIIGHKDPDEDCVSSMVAFALLVTKFNKKASIVLGPSLQENFDYLINICRYNSIELIREGSLPRFSTLVLLDTPKPDMIDRFELYESMRADPSILKIELDHHLAADSRYFGDPEYRLVYEASSTCEIIGRLALKLGRDASLMAQYQIGELMTRNLALAILSGMIGDSQNGRYLKTRRERVFYSVFSTVFEQILGRKTRSGSGNFASKTQVFSALAALSKDESACYRFMSQRIEYLGCVEFIALDEEASSFLFSTYGNDTVVSVAKSLTDKLAESSGYLGLVGYYDDPGLSGFVQFRLRRSQAFSSLDLREALIRLDIKNGGGHPGAIGMRLERDSVPDIVETAKAFARMLTDMVDEIEPPAELAPV